MKRKAQDLNSSEIFNEIINLKPKIKRTKLTNNNINLWVSGTNISNYLLGEPLLDWLNLYYSKLKFNENCNKINTRSQSKNNNSNNTNNTNNSNNTNNTNNSNNNINEENVLMYNGLQFERAVYDYLKLKFKNNEIMEIIPKDNTTSLNDSQFKYYSNKTQDVINKGIPIILQGVLLNSELKLRGIADIVVRSDYVNKLVKKKIIPKDEIKKNGKLYYVIIDIKWTTMTLCVDGMTIRNEGRFKAYKGQLLIYNILLGLMQNYIPECTYIMSKSWKIDSSRDPQEGSSCFDLMGVINYVDRDIDYVQQTINGINWIRYVREYGSVLSPLNLETSNLSVNMSNYYDTPWTNIKKTLCIETKDITAIWNLTSKQRNIGFSKNIKQWTDINCTTLNLDMNSGKKAETIDLILHINKQSEYKVLPNKLSEIKDNRFNWKKKYPTDFYIDFETIGDTFIRQNKNDIDVNNSKGISDFVFMIGVGYEENSEWKYEVFFCNNYTLNDEYNVLLEYINFIKETTKRLDPNQEYFPRLFHWSHAEQTIMEKLLNRHQSLSKLWIELDYIGWVDMCDIFIKTPIVVKGALCFKLKEIGKALFANGLIMTCWENSSISDGLNAMISAIKYYELKKQNVLNDDVKNIFVDIIKYNEIDCKSVWEIVSYLRNR